MAGLTPVIAAVFSAGVRLPHGARGLAVFESVRGGECGGVRPQGTERPLYLGTTWPEQKASGSPRARAARQAFHTCVAVPAGSLPEIPSFAL